MGKKGWFSAIKRVFTPHSKEKLGNEEPERRSGKEKKKKGFGREKSFLPIFREPSSIEKILGEAERDHNLVFRPPTPDRSNPPSASPPPPRPASRRVPSPPRVVIPRGGSPPRANSPSPRGEPPRLDPPRSLSPKPSDRLKPSSAFANAPRVPSQRNAPSIVPSIRSVSPPRLDAPRTHSPRGEPPSLDAPKAPSPRGEPPRLDPPRSLSPKPFDRSKPSSASANAPPYLKPASTRVPSQRIVTPIVPSPRPTSPRVASPQTVSLKLPSPQVESSRLNTPSPPSPRGEPQSLDAPRPPSPKPPSPRADPPRLNTLRPPSPKGDAPRPTTPKPPSPRTASPKRREAVYRPEPTLLVQHASAKKIQTAFRGYSARRSFRALKGLVRLQGVVRGYSVKRQTINALKYMQQVVRVQGQIQSRRIKMLESQAQALKDEAKWAASEAGNDNWDDSVLTKEERDARSQRKTEAIIKRERSMAYAYSHKLWKNSSKSAQDIRSSSGFPLWWNWGDRQLPLPLASSPAPSHSQPLRDYRLTPTRLSPSPLSQSSYQHRFRLGNNFGTSSPKSSRSTLLTPSRPIRPGTSKYSRGRLRGQDSPFRDDDSLTSCPPFPSYMAPTVSAKAKVRPTSNPKERVMGTPVSDEKRRMSYPPAQQGMFRWNKGSLLMSNNGSNKDPGSPGGVVLEKHKTLKSVGNLSFDSTVSVGRKPFNRYV